LSPNKKIVETKDRASTGDLMIKSMDGHRIEGEAGFTLTEVMIAAAMSTAILAAGFGVLTVSQKTTRITGQVSNTQATARNALDMLAADIKLAGFGIQGMMGGVIGGCQVNGIPAAIVPGDNNPAGADSGPDTISLVVPMTNSITAVGPLWQVAAGGPGLIGGAKTTIANIPMPANATTAMGNAIPGGAAALQGMPVSLGGVAGSRIAGVSSGGLSLNPVIPGPTQFGNGMQVYLVQCITYEVVPPPDALNLCQGNAPCLVRGVGVVGAPNTPPRCNTAGNACVPIMDGVEDLQLAYACDGCDPRVNSGTPDGQVDDLNLSITFDQGDFITNRNWYGTAAPYGTYMQPSTIRMAQVNIVARQTRVDQGMGEANQVMVHSTTIPTISDHNHATGVFVAGDNTTPTQQQSYLQFRRRILTRTVELRNQR
jgi:type IV pilus assembly protein PilW